jgi:hypothetical protein
MSCKKKFINLSHFANLIIGLKSFPTFKKNGAHLVEKKGRLKKIGTIHFRGLNALNMQKHF